MTIQITRIHRLDDGSDTRVEFRVSEVHDPAVVSRLESRPPNGPPEIATAFRPTPDVPATYPAGLPFVADVESHTNEYPESGRPPRVRWVTPSDAERVFDDVARQSVAVGWRTDPGFEAPDFHSAVRALFLLREGSIRRISQYEFEGTSIIELEDGARRGS